MCKKTEDKTDKEIHVGLTVRICSRFKKADHPNKKATAGRRFDQSKFREHIISKKKITKFTTKEKNSKKTPTTENP